MDRSHPHARRPKSVVETLVISGVLLCLLWAPIPLGSNRLWAGGVLMVWIALLFAGWGWVLLRHGWSSNQRPSLQTGVLLGLLLLAVQLWVGAQIWAGWSLHPGASVYRLLLGLTYTLLFVLIVGLFYTRRRLTLLLGALVVAGTLQAFYAALSALTGSDWLTGNAASNVATGTYINRSHLAGYLVLTLSAGIGLLLALRDGGAFSWKNLLELLLGPKTRIRVALVIMVIALVMTASRGGNSAFIGALLIVGSWFVIRFREHRSRNLIILLSIIAIDVIVISHYFGLERLKDRLAATEFTILFESGSDPLQRGGGAALTDQTAPTTDRPVLTDQPAEALITVGSTDGWRLTLDVNDGRSLIFRAIMPLIDQNPWLGYGAGAFETVFLSRADPGFAFRLDHAHNDYLQFLVELGLIGTLPLAGFVLICLWLALRALGHPHSYFRSGVGFGAAMGIIGLLIHSWSDFNLQIPANALTFTVICALAVLANTHHSHRTEEHRDTGR